MSLTDNEIEKMIDALDADVSTSVDEGVRSDYEQIVKAVNFIGEEKFKSRLNDIHEAMAYNRSGSARVFWISGLAAAVVGAFFWWQSMRPDLVTPKLQINQIPTYSDSATYDSLKYIDPTVDKK